MIELTLNREPDFQHLDQATGWPMSLRHVEGSGEWFLTVHEEGVTEAQVLQAVQEAAEAAEVEERQRLRARARGQARARVLEQTALERAAQVVRDDATPFEEVLELAPLFPDWEPGLEVAVGDLLYFDGTVVEVIQAHTTQADWEPPDVPALFLVWRDPDEEGIPEWQAGIAVVVGEHFTYDGQTYEVVQAHTTQAGWEPPNVPALWSVVEG